MLHPPGQGGDCATLALSVRPSPLCFWEGLLLCWEVSHLGARWTPIQCAPRENGSHLYACPDGHRRTLTDSLEESKFVNQETWVTRRPSAETR